MDSYRLTTLLVAGALLWTAGCASTATTNTARTAREQMLLSNAVDQSLAKVDFTPLYDQKVFLNEKYLECVDKPYILGTLRHRIMLSGGHIVDKAEDAQIVMEVRSGGVGTDSTESFLGTPEIALPGMLTIPEVRVAERKSQFGFAKIGLVLYDAESKKILGNGGVALAQSDDNNSYILGLGPIQNGSLKKDVQRARSQTPGMERRRLPSTVAFGTKKDLETDTDVQFASQSAAAE